MRAARAADTSSRAADTSSRAADTSYIEVGAENQPTSFVGPDATMFYMVKILRSAVVLHRQTGIVPTRRVTISQLFRKASTLTGKAYKRGEHLKVEADLTTWLSAMATALPHIQRPQEPTP